MGPAGQIVDEDETLLTGEAVALDVRPASFVLRAAGAAIDVACSLTLFVVAMFALGIVSFYLPVDDALVAALSVTALVVSVVLVPTIIETLMKGRSLGKLAIGARIVRDDGGGASFRHALIRALTGVLEIYLTAGGIAIVVGLVNKRAKRLGDLLAGTYSQHERVPRVPQPAPPMPPALYGWAAIADVGRLPTGLARRVAHFLASSTQLRWEARVHLAASLAAEASTYVSPRPPVDDETFLVAITAKRRDREYTALIGTQQRLAAMPAIHGLPHGFPDR